MAEEAVDEGFGVEFGEVVDLLAGADVADRHLQLFGDGEGDGDGDGETDGVGDGGGGGVS